MRLIDADALERDGWKMSRTVQVDKYTMELQTRKPTEFPTIDPHEWMPCSEETGDGYPEEDGFYYVTEQNYGFYLDAVDKQRLAHTTHFKNGAFTNRFYDENHSNITAWMPLPESYKERTDENH